MANGSVRNRSPRIAIVFLLVLIPAFMQSTVRADIAPPPPEIPGTELKMPTAPAIAISGVLLSTALVLAGLAAGRRNSPARARLLYTGAAVVLLLAVGSTVIAAIQHADYKKTLDNWEPLGPAEDFRARRAVETRRN